MFNQTFKPSGIKAHVGADHAVVVAFTTTRSYSVAVERVGAHWVVASVAGPERKRAYGHSPRMVYTRGAAALDRAAQVAFERLTEAY